MSSSDQVFRAGSAPKITARPTVGKGGAPSSDSGQKMTSTPTATTAPATGGTTSTDDVTSSGGATSSDPGPGAPASAPTPSAPTGGPAPASLGPRTVRLTLARIDPLSTLKLSFLLSVALGIGLVVATVVLWQLLNMMGVFSSLNSTLGEAAGGGSSFDIYDYIGLSRVVSLATFVAVINVVLMMALATVAAILYNVAASLVGGLNVTLSDD